MVSTTRSLGLAVLTTVALVGCTAEVPESEQLREVSGCVELPEGVKAATVVNAVQEVGLDRDGCFVLWARVEGPQLAVALTAGGEPVRMGWLSPERDTLDARMTAEALMYYAIGGPLAGLEATEKLQELLAESISVDEVADAIDAALVDDARAFGAEQPEVAEVVAQVAARLLAGKDGEEQSDGPRPAVLVDPGDEQSGVRVVLTSGVNSITLVNSKRRAAHAFVSRVSTFDGEGRETASPAEIKDLPVASVQSLTGWTDGFSQIVQASYSPGGLGGSESVAYVPRSTSPVQVDNVEGAARTRYRLVVVGPGLGAGVSGELTSKQTEQLLFTSARFLVTDFLIPVLVQHVVPNLGAGDAVGDDLLDGMATDLAKLVLQQLPAAANQMAQGDGMGAVSTMWNALVGSNTLRDALLELIIERLYDFRTDASTAATQRASGAAMAFAKAVGAVDALLTAADVSFLVQSVASSNRADAWELDVTAATVRFDPASYEVNPNTTARLNVNVIDASDDAVFEYRFRVDSALGTLANGITTGSSVTFSQPWIDFQAGEDEGTAEVVVEVYEVRLSERVKVGEASAQVEVTDGCGAATPQTARYSFERVPYDCSLVYCSGAHFIYSFRAVEGAMGYQATIANFGHDYSGVSDGTRNLTLYIDDGRPYAHYYDARLLERENNGLFLQRGIAEGELLYIPFAAGWSDDGNPETNYTYETLIPQVTPWFEGASVTIVPICPAEDE
jgi:hypothetical protein